MYASRAVENSGTAIALRGKDGVVFAVEKLIPSKLYEGHASKRIFTVDKYEVRPWPNRISRHS